MKKAIKIVKVYRKEISLFSRKQDDEKSDEFLCEEYELDRNGNQLLSKMFSGDGVMEEQKVNKYDDNGNLVSEEIYTPGIDTVQKRTLEYDQSTNTVIEKIFFEDNNYSKKIITNIEDMTAKIEFFEDGDSLSEAETFEYNENKRMTAHSVFSEDGFLITKDTFEYNQNNDIITEKHFEGDILTEYTKYDYDASGRLIQSEKFADDVSQGITQFEHDNDGNIIKETATSGKMMIYEIMNKYDHHKNCIETEENRPMYQIRRLIKRKFDHENNLIEEISSGTDNYVNRVEYEFYYEV